MKTGLKPSKRIFATALRYEGSYVGQFALPGRVPEFVHDKNKAIVLYPDADAAELAAARTMIDVWSRRQDLRFTRVANRRKMSAGELSDALDELDITATLAADILGYPLERFLEFLDGARDVPHAVALAIELMKADTANFDKAVALRDWRDEEKNDE